jgi:hypothetical protein
LSAFLLSDKLLGFPTGWSFTTHKETSGAINHALAALFLAPLPGREVEDLCKGSFRTHILYFVICFALLYLFLPASFYIKNPKKLESLVVVFTYLLLVLLKWPILKTPSCVTLLARTIVILSALLLHHLLLLQTFMRLSLLC